MRKTKKMGKFFFFQLELTSAIGRADVSCECGRGAGRLAGRRSRVRSRGAGNKIMPEASSVREGTWKVVWL
jgi:hypothetical protein